MSSTEVLFVRGGRPLQGEVEVQGSKNATLPMLAASLLATEGQTVLHRVPPVNDVLVALEVLRPARRARRLRCDRRSGRPRHPRCQRNPASRGFDQSASAPRCFSSVRCWPVLAALGSKRSAACTIGSRPTDYHYRGFARLGAEVEGVNGGGIDVVAKQLSGAFMYCDPPQSYRSGKPRYGVLPRQRASPVIENAASDPEIVDFTLLLQKMGAQVEGVGTRQVHIKGVDELVGAEAPRSCTTASMPAS